MKQIVVGYNVEMVNLDTCVKRVVFSGASKEECLNYCKQHTLSLFVPYRYFIVPRMESQFEFIQLDIFNEKF